MTKQKKVKRHINFKGLIFIILLLYIIGMLLYTIFSMPLKNIYIKGTTLLSDNEIIEVAGIKNYPSMFKISTSSLKKKISTLDLVDSVKVTKKLNGKLYIEITENKPLFYNRNNERVVLSNALEVENSSIYKGIPTLINSVPKDIYQKFIESFKEINPDIISLINEIEYDPSVSNDITIDEYRFLLRMNDGNHVYVNVLNMKKLNDYLEIYDYLTTKGTLYLDSYSKDNNNNLFKSFSEDVSSNGVEDKLSE